LPGHFSAVFFASRRLSQFSLRLRFLLRQIADRSGRWQARLLPGQIRRHRCIFMAAFMMP
jgi:hypothetical protein